MFYYLIHNYESSMIDFESFGSILSRFGFALMTSLLLSLIFGSWVIRVLKRWQVHGQPIRETGMETHILEKQGTPTMGGVLILGSLLLSTLLWADLSNAFIWIILSVTLCFGLLGFIDDYLKVKHRDNYSGIPGRLRLIIGSIISLCALFMISHFVDDGMMMGISMPFFHNFLIDYGIWLFFPFGILVIVGSANAVNLTDGLDGLVIVPCIITVFCFSLISYLVGHEFFSDYLYISHVSGTAELSIFCGALIGSGFGFLWFNAHPAKVFMGDTGSLAIGASLGCLAIMTKHEMALAIIGGLFVIETVSVMLQVASFKLTGKRIFAMAPLHHHFEKHGWSETTVVIRFWIVSIVFALIGLASLRLK